MVPTVSTDAPFIFTETTANFQDVSIQGSFTYRISDPVAIAQVLDFTIVPGKGNYRSDDPIKLTQRIVNAVQAHTRTHVSTMPLEEALTDVGPLANEVLESLAELEAVLAERCVALTDEPGRIRDLTLYHWWPGGADHPVSV